MRFTVPYGEGMQEFETDIPCRVLENASLEAGHSGKIMSEALSHPLGTKETFADFVSSTDKLLLIVCDGTRPTPTALVLEHMHKDIRYHPDIGFLIATGTHRDPTAEEYELIFGKYFDDFRNRTAVHHSKDKSVLQDMGVTSRGTPVSFNMAVLEADGIVTINSVEPHYFAGFTGGRKSFLPGIAGFESIEKNHSHATDPGTAPLAMIGNPVWEDIHEAFDFLKGKRVFTVQTVVLPDGRLHSAFAGDLDEAFGKAAESAAQIYSVNVQRKANIVITAAPPPMDRDLYQSQKAMEHGRLALEEGGVLVLVSSCWDGIGDRGFYDLLSRLGEHEDIGKYLGRNYRLGNHKAARWLDLCKRFSLWGVTDLDGEVLRTARMRGFATLQQAVDEAIGHVRSKGREPSINLIPNGSFAVPKVTE